MIYIYDKHHKNRRELNKKSNWIKKDITPYLGIAIIISCTWQFIQFYVNGTEPTFDQDIFSDNDGDSDSDSDRTYFNTSAESASYPNNISVIPYDWEYNIIESYLQNRVSPEEMKRYLLYIENNDMTKKDVYLHERNWLQGKYYYYRVQTEIVVQMCDGIHYKEIKMNIEKLVKSLGYSEMCASFLTNDILSVRKNSIVLWDMVSDSFTAQDISMRRANDPEEINTIYELMSKYRVDYHKERMFLLNEAKFYLLKKGYSKNYIEYSLRIIDLEMRRINTEENKISANIININN